MKKKGLRIVRVKKDSRTQGIQDFLDSYNQCSDFMDETIKVPAFTNLQEKILRRLKRDYEANAPWHEGLELKNEDQGHLKLLIKRGFIVKEKNSYKLVCDWNGLPLCEIN